MSRSFLFALILMVLPFTAAATEAPSAQAPIGPNNILRGSFIEEHQMSGANGPMRSSGHFVVAPAYGLIWNIEDPLPVSMVITPNEATQNIGGLIMKLPAKNLRHLYDTVGGALTGDWSGLEKDFVITPGGDAHHWQMLLTPRQDGGKPKLSYATITVSGSRYVENIVMTKGDGSYDTLSFANAVLSSPPLSAKEMAAFSASKP